MEDVFFQLREADERIALLQKELKSSLVQPETLLALSKEIEALENFVDSYEYQDHIEEHREMLVELFGRWHTLFIDAEITQIAEDAQRLSEGNGDKADLELLEQHIKDLCVDEALSIENQLMITLSRRFLAKAMEKISGKKKVSTMGEEPRVPLSDIEIGEITEHLFEIAQELYEGCVRRGVNRFNLLDEGTKRLVLHHFNQLEGNMNAFGGNDLKALRDHAFRLTQALLAASKEIVSGVADPVYPDAEEVDSMLSSTDLMM